MANVSKIVKIYLCTHAFEECFSFQRKRETHGYKKFSKTKFSLWIKKIQKKNSQCFQSRSASTCFETPLLVKRKSLDLTTVKWCWMTLSRLNDDVKTYPEGHVRCAPESQGKGGMWGSSSHRPLLYPRLAGLSPTSLLFTEDHFCYNIRHYYISPALLSQNNKATTVLITPDA